MTGLDVKSGDIVECPARPRGARSTPDSAPASAPNIVDWRAPLRKSERPNGGRKAAQGSHPREESVEGTARETHAAGATAVHRCRLGARTRPGSGGGAPN